MNREYISGVVSTEDGKVAFYEKDFSVTRLLSEYISLPLGMYILLSS